jgi:hypothetical protein
MPLSETVKHQADALMKNFCERRVPLEVRDRVRMSHEFRANTVTLFEDRPRWDKPSEWIHMPIAQFRFDATSGRWALYCADRNTRWHLYELVSPTRELAALLKEVDKDLTGIFFG